MMTVAIDRRDNLCDYCEYERSSCKGMKYNTIVFGEGKGNNNIIQCGSCKLKPLPTYAHTIEYMGCDVLITNAVNPPITIKDMTSHTKADILTAEQVVSKYEVYFDVRYYKGEYVDMLYNLIDQLLDELNQSSKYKY